MIVAIQGTKNFNDYNIFLRAIGTVMMAMDANDKNILVYSVGTRRVNEMVKEFFNVSERSLKARGIKFKVMNLPVSVVEKDISNIDYVIYLSRPKEPLSSFVELAEEKDLEVLVYRY